jgi:mannosylglycerate hydrolase
MFPTGIDAQYSYGEGQFDVVSRPIARKDTSDWIEQPMYDYPMHHFVDVSDSQSGAAVLVDGLKEYEVLDDADRTLAITLLRGFRYIIQPSSVQDFSEQKGSQCLGRQRYRLAFYPHRGRWDEGRVFQEALRFNYPLRLFQMGRSEGDMPEKWRFISIEPDMLVLSSLKAAETDSGNSVVLRVYNPTTDKLNGMITFANKIMRVEEVTMEEIHIRYLQLESDGTLRIEIPSKKIKTIRLKLKPFKR